MTCCGVRPQEALRHKSSMPTLPARLRSRCHAARRFHDVAEVVQNAGFAMKRKEPMFTGISRARRREITNPNFNQVLTQLRSERGRVQQDLQKLDIAIPSCR